MSHALSGLALSGRQRLRFPRLGGLIPRNVVAVSKAPRTGSSMIDDVFTEDEARQLTTAAIETPNGAVFILAIAVGLRKGELLALKWDQVDLDRGTVRISGTLTRRVGHGLVVTPPKTDRSARTVQLPSFCVEALRRHRDEQSSLRDFVGTAWTEQGFVFTAPNGSPLDPRNLGRAFDNLCRDAGVDRRRFHATRHTSATLMLRGGVPLAVICKVLGHSSIQVTADLYAKVVDSLSEDAAGAMDQLLGRNSEPAATPVAT